MILRATNLPLRISFCLIALCLLIPYANASWGDRQDDFRECVRVCERENCASNRPTTIPLHRRLLLWDCPSECDYTCQHIITELRVARNEEIVQFHGKWPFYRFMGMQEPFSVLFSLFNFAAHRYGLNKLIAHIPASYTMRKYYVVLAYLGMITWFSSAVFHIRDFKMTEELDYFAAGASVLYGLYYTLIRVFRLDLGGRKTKSLLRVWTILCIVLYVAHFTYLKMYKWDYGYNMAANVVLGIIQNAMWTFFSFQKYKKSGRVWAMWPGMVVAWLILAMSLELLDFPPWWGCLDAHSLWHLGTVGPTMVMYNFLLKDAQDDMEGQRLKA